VTTARTVTVRVPAKVNLELAVGQARPDGYHSLVTVFHAVSLFDKVTVSPAERLTVHVTGEGAGAVPLGRANLAAKAVAALQRATGRAARHTVRIEIHKRIPVAAGLAGGSADAAAALLACNELWRAGLSLAELSEIAAEIGSDVPFALAGGTAIGHGRGERLTAALVSGSYHWVLAFAEGGLSTADVYATCDRLRAARRFPAGASGPQATSQQVDHRQVSGQPLDHPPAPSPALLAALRSGDPAAVGPLLANDLQPAAVSLMPALRRTLAAGREFGALGAMVSGSGPTCAFLAADADRARELAVALTGAGVCRSVVRASGPAPGAVVLPDPGPASHQAR
jgi:4-diphosphocytidyl-2-C-methyl-D-erythritol kinase